MGKGQDKKKTSFDPKEKAPDAAASQPGQTVNPLTSSICFLLFFYLFIYLFIIIIIFKKRHVPYFLYYQWKYFSFIFYIFIVYIMGFVVNVCWSVATLTWAESIITSYE